MPYEIFSASQAAQKEHPAQRCRRVEKGLILCFMVSVLCGIRLVTEAADASQSRAEIAVLAFSFRDLPKETTVFSAPPQAPPTTRGNYRRCVRAAGASYYSGWKVSTNSVRRNTAPKPATSAVASPAAYSSETIALTWSGASGGTSPVKGYQIASRTSLDNSSWGAWNVLTIDAVSAFQDGINFEVLPAFINKDGSSFTYPNSNNGGSWKTTDPRAEITAIKDMNDKCNNNLKPLCRMMRAWKNKCDVSISGILIDILAYRFISTWGERDKSFLYYDWMSRDFFQYLSEQDTKQTLWQAMGSGRYIYHSGSYVTKAKAAYDLAV